MSFKNLQFVGLFLVFLCMSHAALAVKIIPPRLVVDADSNVEHVFIKNDSDFLREYRFSWKHFAMTEDGETMNLDGKDLSLVPGYRPVDDIVRFSPRRAILKPGEVQRVTLLLRRTPDLADGEYRSHFVVGAVPNSKRSSGGDVEGGGAEVPAKPDVQVPLSDVQTSVGIGLLVSRAFPVYVRHGETSASLDLVSARLERNPDSKTRERVPYRVQFDLAKEGNRSVLGLADVYCDGVKVSKVPKVFSVYAEAKRRAEKMVVFPPDAGCGSMRLIVTGHPDDSFSGQILGEIEVSR